ncbi:MAG TPA: hypothetical protein VL026_06360 [Rhizomicrobium sp.]|nr:hypothetical protein [Rhizomicrobium sp.]
MAWLAIKHAVAPNNNDLNFITIPLNGRKWMRRPARQISAAGVLPNGGEFHASDGTVTD